MPADRRWLIVGVLSGGVFMTATDNTIVNVALPSLVRDLHASTSELQWIVDAYTLAYAGLVLTAGSLGDRFGRALTLKLGLLLFGASSAVAAWAQTPTTLIACRAVMAVGGAFMLPTTLSIIVNLFSNPVERARAVGAWSGVAGIGLSMGPIVGGFLLSRFWVGSVFLVNVPVTAVVLAFVLWLVPESVDPEQSRFDLLGMALSILAIGGFLWATIEAPGRGWTNAVTLGAYAASVGLLAAFIFYELHRARPLLDLSLFRSHGFSASNGAGIVTNVAFAGGLFVVSQLLQFVRGYSPAAAGVRLVPLSVGFMLMAFAGPRLAERLGTRTTVAIGFTTMALGAAVLAAWPDSGYGIVLAGTVLMGGGLGVAHGPLTTVAMTSAPRESAGIAAGTVSMTRQIGTALGVAVIGSLLASGYHSRLRSRIGAFELSGPDRARANASVGGALAVARKLGGRTGSQFEAAARDAFAHGTRLAYGGAALVVLAAVGLVLRYLPAKAPQ